MNTKYYVIDEKSIDAGAIKEAGQIIKDGGLVAFPTETVYGLGGDALNPDSSKKIYAAKGRPSDNPLIVHIARIEDLANIAENIPESALKLADRYWPGPLTMIFKKKEIVPAETTGGLDTVAVRFPSNKVSIEFIKASGGYVAAPSANLSGRPSTTSAAHVKEDLDGRIDAIIDSGSCDIGLESTIVDFTGNIPMLLRPGYVSYEMLCDLLGEVEKDPAVFGNGDAGVAPKAPGMKYRHYAPKGKLSIVKGTRQQVKEYIQGRLSDKSRECKIGVITCSDMAGLYESADFIGDIGDRGDEFTIAKRLYDVLRQCDAEAIDEIYCEEFDTPNMGLAIMNRLIKAAGHTVINLSGS